MYINLTLRDDGHVALGGKMRASVTPRERWSRDEQPGGISSLNHGNGVCFAGLRKEGTR